jgi:hypothetical protein
MRFIITRLKGGAWADLADICQPTYRIPITRSGQLRLF